MVRLAEWVYRWNLLGLNGGIYQRTLCFARRRTVIPAIVSRKVAESPGVLKICVSGSIPLASYLLNETTRITKMKKNCLKQFDEHWNFLESNDQV